MSDLSKEIDPETLMDVLEDYENNIATRIAGTDMDNLTAELILADLESKGISVVPTAYLLSLENPAAAPVSVGGGAVGGNIHALARKQANGRFDTSDYGGSEGHAGFIEGFVDAATFFATPAEASASLERVLEKWVDVRPGELDEDAVALFLEQLALAGLQITPVLHPAQAADEARANFVQLAYAAKSQYPGLPEGYTHDDIDRLYQWASDADDTLRLAPAMLSPAPSLLEGNGGQKWVSVSERLPNNTLFQSSSIVLGHLWNGTQLAVYYDYAAGFWREHTEGSKLNITHWQPLPAAPVAPAGTKADAARPAHDYSSYVSPEVVKYVDDKAKRHGAR